MWLNTILSLRGEQLEFGSRRILWNFIESSRAQTGSVRLDSFPAIANSESGAHIFESIS